MLFLQEQPDLVLHLYVHICKDLLISLFFRHLNNIKTAKKLNILNKKRKFIVF